MSAVASAAQSAGRATGAPLRRRSWLIVPASKRDPIDEAARSGADVVVLDLVELVAGKDKAAARSAVGDAIGRFGAAAPEVFVQTEPSCADTDLAACVWPGVR